MIAHGDVVWVDFGSPRGSEPAKRRPAIVLQEDWLLASRIETVLAVPVTSNLAQAAFPGNVLLSAAASGLEKDSVALVMQLGPISRSFVEPYPVGSLPRHLVADVATGVRLVTGI